MGVNGKYFRWERIPSFPIYVCVLCDGKKSDLPPVCVSVKKSSGKKECSVFRVFFLVAHRRGSGTHREGGEDGKRGAYRTRVVNPVSGKYSHYFFKKTNIFYIYF